MHHLPDAKEEAERVVAALDTWLGRYVGAMFGSEIGSLFRNPAMQLGEMVDPVIAAAGAINNSLKELDRESVLQLDRAQPVIVYCHDSQ